MEEFVVVWADFTTELITARGLDLGLGVLSSREIRIPRNVRKKITIKVLVAMNKRFLIMKKVFNIKIHFCQFVYSTSLHGYIQSSSNHFFKFNNGINSSGCQNDNKPRF